MIRVATLFEPELLADARALARRDFENNVSLLIRQAVRELIRAAARREVKP